MELADGDSSNANRVWLAWLSLSSRGPDLGLSPVRLLVCGFKACGQRNEWGGLSIVPVEVLEHLGIGYDMLRVHELIAVSIAGLNATASDIRGLREVVVDVVKVLCRIVDAIVMASKSG